MTSRFIDSQIINMARAPTSCRPRMSVVFPAQAGTVPTNITSTWSMLPHPDGPPSLTGAEFLQVNGDLGTS
jgi:hypothetical protein